MGTIKKKKKKCDVWIFKLTTAKMVSLDQVYHIAFPHVMCTFFCLFDLLFFYLLPLAIYNLF